MSDTAITSKNQSLQCLGPQVDCEIWKPILAAVRNPPVTGAMPINRAVYSLRQQQSHIFIEGVSPEQYRHLLASGL